MKIRNDMSTNLKNVEGSKHLSLWNNFTHSETDPKIFSQIPL